MEGMELLRGRTYYIERINRLLGEISDADLIRRIYEYAKMLYVKS